MIGKPKSKVQYDMKNILVFFLWITCVLLIAVCLRILFFSLYTIPSPSMEPTIMSGDRIIANKFIPGPRILKNLKFITTGERPEFWRLKGVRQIQRNDILVFNFPYPYSEKLTMNLNLYYVKRCVGLPGDTVRIINGFLNVSGCKDTLGNYDAQVNISKIPSESFEDCVYTCFPFDRKKWTIKQFGPLYIPSKGDQIDIDTANISLYKNIIEYESGKKIMIKDESIFLGDVIIDRYIFSVNYYFMAGDYAPDSRDSRYWGLLPEDHIVGKAAVVWLSKDPHSGKYRTNRFLNKIK